MNRITGEQFVDAISESKNFRTFEEAKKKGFQVMFKNGKGFALQVDTSKFEWVEIRHTAEGEDVTFWGSN